MAKASVLDALYTKKSSPHEFNFDMLTAPPLLSLLTYQDIAELNRIARSVKLSGKIQEKYKLIDNIMNNRGFVKLHAGTNRVVYRFIEDQRFVIKVAVDKVGLGDNPAEFRNQFLLKPFVTRVFEVSVCGTVALVERVDAIMSREEFMSVADDVFHLLTKVFIGKYILEDVGAAYFMNYGVRKSFGPVLLDFPYVYELDGNKLYCNSPVIPGRKDVRCNGELDYDDGFNNLICTKCRKHYQARELKKAEKNDLIIVGGKKTMDIKIMVGNRVIKDTSKKKVAKVIDPEPEVEVVIPEVEMPKDAIFNKKEDIGMDKEHKDVLDYAKEYLANHAYDNCVEPVDGDSIKLTTTPEEIKTEVIDAIKRIDNDINGIENELKKEAMEAEYEDEYVDEYEDEEDVEEYDHYLSNRDRSKIRKAQKSNRANNNFESF